MVNRQKKDRIPQELSTYIKYLHQHGGVGIRELWRRYPQYFLKTIQRHATAPVVTSRNGNAGNSHNTRGRRKSLTARDERSLMRSLRENRMEGRQVT